MLSALPKTDYPERSHVTPDALTPEVKWQVCIGLLGTAIVAIIQQAMCQTSERSASRPKSRCPTRSGHRSPGGVTA